MKQERILKRNKHTYENGPILYWMDREMRVSHNWALLRAIELGKQQKQPVGVMFNLVKNYLGGGERQYQFKLQALRELEARFKEKNIPFQILLTDDSVKDVVRFCKKQKVGYVVTDMNPLRLNQQWKKEVARAIDVPFEEVDAHNVVPIWQTSQKQEFAARTIRPKIHRVLPDYLDSFPTVRKQSKHALRFKKNDWKTLEKARIDKTVTAVDWIKPGQKAAQKVLKQFIEKRLRGYAEKRNDPNEDHLSNLSPYFHYGMLSPQHAAMQVAKSGAPRKDVEAFIEEAVVRRELSDNFCYYNKDYDSFKGLPEWAQKTLNEHRNDRREYIYTRDEFEHAKTHDALWNAAQLQMVKTGKMHGYMRMYWAKKILEWTNTPETALKFAIYLNDKYELDGRDPNGYVGCAWSIGGVHDRAWTERPVYGKIRYMNANGCARKFDVDTYIKRWTVDTLL